MQDYLYKIYRRQARQAGTNFKVFGTGRLSLSKQLWHQIQNVSLDHKASDRAKMRYLTSNEQVEGKTEADFVMREREAEKARPTLS